MIGSVKENLVGVGRVPGGPTADILRPVRTAVSAGRIGWPYRAINRGHNGPELARPVPVVSDAVMAEGGKYRWEKATGRPVDIRLNRSSAHLDVTTVLEIGHPLG